MAERQLSENLPPLRDIISRFGLSARRSLGQNFLLDRNLLARIARIPGDLSGQCVYEVGPGPGGLTAALLMAGASVTAVERDERALPALAELQSMAPRRLTIVAGDALAQEEQSMLAGPAHVVANLPYNIATPLLVRWLTAEPWPPWWLSLTLMFQEEVAERIVAAPGTRSYGRLSVLSRWRADARIAMRLPARAFTPQPKVDSAVVHFEPRTGPPGVLSSQIEAITGAGFGQRRKMLRSSLKHLPGALHALREAGLNEEDRAEALSIDDFVRVAQLLPGR